MARFYTCLRCGSLKCVFLHELYCPECQIIVENEGEIDGCVFTGTPEEYEELKKGGFGRHA